MKFNIITFGCKVNQYESNMMKETMLHHNFSFTPNFEDADIIIINTCTVTNVADQKCLKQVRSIKRNHPEKLLVVAGCSVQNKLPNYTDLDIAILLGNKDKTKIADYINDYLNNQQKVVNHTTNRNLTFEDMQIKDYDHTRAFVKIQDGCNNFCSYCIIPFVRGTTRSKNFDQIITEVKALVATNHKEIVLTGIHTGAYSDSGKDLSDVINVLAEIDGLERIRISSIEITELNDKFLNTLKNCNKLCDNLHIPLQAGSDEVLLAMNRKYDLKYYEEKIKTIRSIRPGISITTDIIVGFPGETDEMFNHTYEFAKKIAFAKIHVFPYSKREGTKAAVMPQQINGNIKKQRVAKLIALSESLEKAYFDQFKSQELEVLIEKVDKNQSFGHTSNYLYVTINEILQIGNIYRRKI